MNGKKITLVTTNEWYIKKVNPIAKYKGMPTGLKTKDRNKTIYFDYHWTAGVDYHCESIVSSRENGEDNEKDSDHELESNSDIESNTDDDDDDETPPDLQEALDNSESDSDDE